MTIGRCSRASRSSAPGSPSEEELSSFSSSNGVQPDEGLSNGLMPDGRDRPCCAHVGIEGRGHVIDERGHRAYWLPAAFAVARASVSLTAGGRSVARRPDGRQRVGQFVLDEVGTIEAVGERQPTGEHLERGDRKAEHVGLGARRFPPQYLRRGIGR